MSRRIAMVTKSATACSETVLYDHEDTPENRAKVEAESCGDRWDSPIPGSWIDVTDNDACDPNFDAFGAA